jgi:hypothetical protein
VLVRYEVRVAPLSGGGEGRFELERDEPLKAGDLLRQGDLLYEVIRVLPVDDSDDDFDVVVVAEWRAGPAQAYFTP